MPTPDVYALGIKQPFDDALPEELRSVDVNVMYATDRIPESREDGRLDYGIYRDHSLSVGEAVVSIGGDASWEKLASDARTGVRSETLHLGMKSVTENARGVKGALIYYDYDGSLVATGDSEAEFRALGKTTREMVRQRLDQTPRKEILLYVHGVKTSFDKAIYTTAELWHFLGREFVPITYTWPAGHGGLLKGYTYDRESSEFTVFHFKRFLTWLADMPEVEGIHIIAHSRGTDVVFTAVRELFIEVRGPGVIPHERLKLRNVVIASPDINLEVAMQRTEREGTVWAAERWTTYTSEHDKAIGVSEWLFGGGRFGKAKYDGMDEFVKMWMDNFPDLETTGRDTVIEYVGRSGGAGGHSYFRSNPAVASDLVLTVRYGLAPGAENGRPLQHVDGFFWKIDDNYLNTLKSQ